VDCNDGTQGRSLARSMHVAALAHLIFGNSAGRAATGRLKMPRADAKACGVAGAGRGEAGAHLPDTQVSKRARRRSAGACAHAGKKKVRGAGRRGSAVYFSWRLLTAPLPVRCPLAPPIVTFPYSRGGVEPPVGVGPPGTGRVSRRALRESSRCLRHDRRYRLPLAPVRPHPLPVHGRLRRTSPRGTDEGIITQVRRAGISSPRGQESSSVSIQIPGDEIYDRAQRMRDGEYGLVGLCSASCRAERSLPLC
jgi:hypothetical protein